MKKTCLMILVGGLTATSLFAGRRVICIDGHEFNDQQIAIVEQYERMNGIRIPDGCYRTDPRTGQLALVKPAAGSRNGYQAAPGNGFWSNLKRGLVQAYQQQQMQMQMQQGYGSRPRSGAPFVGYGNYGTTYSDGNGFVGVNIDGQIWTN